jgi:hypothetical protein
MGPDRYLPYLPTILNWIDQTLDAHADEKRAVSSFKFLRLPNYFSGRLLDNAFVVPADQLPVPPLSAFGLREFADLENQSVSGITYKDTYFVQRSSILDESVHFHELVYVIQWQFLGPRDFLLLYADGLAERGTAIVRSKKWRTITRAGSIPGSRRTRLRREFGERR